MYKDNVAALKNLLVSLMFNLMNELRHRVKSIISIIGKILSIVGIFFVINSIMKQDLRFDRISNWKSFYIVIMLGISLKVISVFISASTWSLWLEFWANKKIDKLEGTCVYLKANIGKYIPGNVMHYIERNLFASEMGISQKRIAASSIMEIICQVLVSMMLFLSTGADTVHTILKRIKEKNSFNGTSLIIILIIALTCVVLFYFRKKVYIELQNYTKKRFLNTLLQAVVRYFIVLSLLGVIMVLLYSFSGNRVDFRITSSIIAGYIVAWVIGFITPGASGGLGIREMVLILLLRSIMGEEIIALLSVIHRIITTVGDFLAYFMQIIITNKRKTS